MKNLRALLFGAFLSAVALQSCNKLESFPPVEDLRDGVIGEYTIKFDSTYLNGQNRTALALAANREFLSQRPDSSFVDTTGRLTLSKLGKELIIENIRFRYVAGGDTLQTLRLQRENPGYSFLINSATLPFENRARRTDTVNSVDLNVQGSSFNFARWNGPVVLGAALMDTMPGKKELYISVSGFKNEYKRLRTGTKRVDTLYRTPFFRVLKAVK